MSESNGTTVYRVLEATARRLTERPALVAKHDGEWRPVSWSGYLENVRATARGLMALGAQQGKGVTILGFNRPEWFYADIGAIAAGAVPTGIYTTSTPDQCAYILEHCEAPVAVIEGPQYLDQILSARPECLRWIVLMTGTGRGEGVITWQQMIERGQAVKEEELDARIEVQRPDDLCTLIYTSGTTGPPKGVMLSNRNLTWISQALINAYTIGPEDNVVSYLPLSHIAEQVVSLHAPLLVGATTWFAESIEKLGNNLREARPTFFFAVPRVWEKIQAGIQAAGAQNPPLKKKIAAWARAKGLAGGYAEQRGESKPFGYGLANKLVFSKVREKLGLDRARICATSAAPISLDTLEFFLSLGIPVLEVYGMSEVTGPGTFSLPDRYHSGKAGFEIPGAGLSIASDGEILMRGPHVFLGYFKNEEATRETLDDDGWLHSGDIGTIDEQGFLQVTDRKKELIITSGGKNISPANLEARLKEIPVVAQAVVVGERQKYVAALLALDPDRVEAEAKAAGSPATDTASAATCPIFREHLARQVEGINKTLASYETLKRFEILPDELTVESGELTPTMKLKRRVINERHADAIGRLFA